MIVARSSAAGVAAFPGVDWFALGPVLAPAVALALVLLVDAAAPPSSRLASAGGGRGLRAVHDLVAGLGLLVAAGFVEAQARELVHGRAPATLCPPAPAGALPVCSYRVSELTLTAQALVLAGAVVCLLLGLGSSAARDRTAHHVLFLAAVTGALALAGARDLISLVVALEVATLPVVGLVGLRGTARGGQAALTLLLTAVTSLGLLLFGVAVLVLVTGSVQLEVIGASLAADGAPPAVRTLGVVGVLLALAGMAFKLSAAPFHLWTPDTYGGAPVPVAAFLSVVSKAAALTAAVLLLALGAPGLAGAWAPAVGGLGALTMTVGNLMALRQRVAVRLLAASTIAQAGWVLLALGAARPGTPTALRTAAAASLGYLAAYGVAALAVFTVVVLVSRHHPAGEEHGLGDYRGLARREPVAAAVLAFALACLAGLPPGVVGLVAKVGVLRPLVDGGAWALAGVAALNVVLALVYHLRWAAALFATSTDQGPAASGPLPGAVLTWRVRPAEGLALGISGAACVALSVWPQAIAGLLPGLLR